MSKDSSLSAAAQVGVPQKLPEKLSAAAYRALISEPKRGNRGARGHYGIDGEHYASDAEEILLARLRQRERIGEIRGLTRQIRFDLHALGGGYIGYVKIDAGFFDVIDNRQRYQDAKGDRVRDTRESDWKFKHVKAEYGVEVEKVRIKTRKR